MVNPTIVSYLSSNKNFPVFELKNKIITSGYSEKEFYDAANYLGLINKKIKSKIKWIKISGFVSIFFLIGIIISIYPTINSLINGFLPNYFNLNNNSLILFGLLFYIATVIFYFGFERMGTYSKNKTLKITSWIFIILTTFLIIIYIIELTYQNISISLELTSKTIFLIKAILFLAIFQIILFNIGVILSGRRVKFSKVAGTFGIVSTLLLIASIIKVYYDIKTNPNLITNILYSFLINDLDSFNGLISLYVLIILTNQIIISLTSFFQSLCLFSASKKFEY